MSASGHGVTEQYPFHWGYVQANPGQWIRSQPDHVAIIIKQDGVCKIAIVFPGEPAIMGEAKTYESAVRQIEQIVNKKTSEELFGDERME